MPDRDPRIEEAIRWFGWASGELAGARADLEQPDLPPRLAAAGAQQAAEKALKAALIVANVDVARVHNLNALRNALPPDWSIHQSHPDLSELTEAALSRYPDSAVDLSRDDALRVVEEAVAVYESLIGDAERLADIGRDEVIRQ